MRQKRGGGNGRTPCKKARKSVTKDAEKDSVTLTRGRNEGQKDIIQFYAANRTVGVVFFFFCATKMML